MSSILLRFRRVGFLEALSFLLLVCVAMPLKYLADMPLAVRVVGMIHGVLFILYCLSLLQCWKALSWPGRKVGLLFVASLLPGGPMFADRGLKREQQKLS